MPSAWDFEQEKQPMCSFVYVMNNSARALQTNDFIVALYSWSLAIIIYLWKHRILPKNSLIPSVFRNHERFQSYLRSYLLIIYIKYNINLLELLIPEAWYWPGRTLFNSTFLQVHRKDLTYFDNSGITS